MRKLFWGCTICGILLSGSVISTAYFAVHHPESLAGRVLRGATYAAGVINPVSGFGPVVAKTTDGDTGCKDVDEPMPADPVPADPVAVGPTVENEEDGKLEEAPIVVANTGSAPIVIHEEDQLVGGIHMPPPETINPPPPALVQAPAECLPAAVPCGPETMPYCPEEKSEVLPMPHKEANTLPMPKAEEEQECCDEDYFKETMMELFSRRGKDSKGLSIPATEPAGSCPAADPCKPESKPREFEPEASSKPHNLFRDASECTPQHPEVDTLEYRSGDRSMYDYGAFDKAAPL